MNIYILSLVVCLFWTVNGKVIQSIYYYNKQGKVPKPVSGSPLKIIVHGWWDMGTENAPGWVTQMKNTILSMDSENPYVMVVNWNSMPMDSSIISSIVTNFMSGNVIYFSSANSVSTVGGEIIAELKSQGYTSFDKIHCIGHSLGSHVCGFAGKAASPKFKRITGLDPAHPNFRTASTAQRLSSTDASYVDVYHSNSGYLGLPFSIGQADFYLNNSGVQPGCSTVSLGCSHSRSHEYFLATITRDKKTCTTGVAQSGNGRVNPTGYWNTNAMGNYNIATSATSPFC